MVAHSYTFGMGVQRLDTPDSEFLASGIGAGVKAADAPLFEVEYDTSSAVVITHQPTGRVFKVEMQRWYCHRGRGIRDRITRLQEGFNQSFWPFYLTWRAIDLETPALIDWYEADYETPEELVEACQDMLTLIIAGGAA